MLWTLLQCCIVTVMQIKLTVVVVVAVAQLSRILSTPFVFRWGRVSTTSFPGSLFSASIVVENDNGGREERPWERGWCKHGKSSVVLLLQQECDKRTDWPEIDSRNSTMEARSGQNWLIYFTTSNLDFATIKIYFHSLILFLSHNWYFSYCLLIICFACNFLRIPREFFSPFLRINLLSVLQLFAVASELIFASMMHCVPFSSVVRSILPEDQYGPTSVFCVLFNISDV